jgi:uncharacterized iron-regulated membrane protein
MRRLRAVVFWAHLLTGITIGSIVLIMAATGALLTYQRQIQAWADTRGLDYAPPEGATPLATEQLLARVQAAHNGPITGVRWRRDGRAPIEVESGRETLLFVDAYSGAILGLGSERTRGFFGTVTDAHRWLALRGSQQSTGRAITGVANLGFLFMLLSGFYLWWPRNLSARALRNTMLFRRGLRPRARDFNWHNVIGFWSLVPLTTIVMSAAVISYGWASSLLERVAAQPADTTSAATTSQPRAPAGLPSQTGVRQRASNEQSDVDLLGRAKVAVPRWRSITMQLPARDGAVTFIIDTGTGGQPHRIARLTLADSTGAVLGWRPFSSEPRAARVRGVLRYAHTGEALGVAGQTLAGLVSAGTVLLVWTGISLALRRLARWRTSDDPEDGRAYRGASDGPDDTVA